MGMMAVQTFSKRGDAILVWTRRTSSTISIISSSAVMYMIIIDWKEKLKQPSNRLFLVMTFFDIIQSLANAFASAPLPSDTEIYGAIGNDATCVAQGFFTELGLTVPLYNASLSLYYMLSIRYKMRSKDFAKRVEPFCHAASVLFPLTIAIIGLSLDRFGPRGLVCWIKKSPFGNFPLLLSFALAEISLCFIFILFNMALTYLSVKEREKAMLKYDFKSNKGARLSISNKGLVERRETLNQAFFYVASFAITFIWPMISVLVFEVANQRYYAVRFLTCLFYPLQGFWNFLSYSRRGCIKLKQQNPDKSYIWVLFMFVKVPASVRRISLIRRYSVTQNGDTYEAEQDWSKGDEETNSIVPDSNEEEENSFYPGSKMDRDTIKHADVCNYTGICNPKSSLFLVDESISQEPISIEVLESSCAIADTSRSLKTNEIELEESDTKLGSD